MSVTLRDGQSFDSGPSLATGAPEPQPSQDEVLAKFRRFVVPVLGEERCAGIIRAALDLSEVDANSETLTRLLTENPSQFHQS